MTDQKDLSEATIVPLSAHLTARAPNAIRLTEAYWSALRQDGALPERSQVDPRGLETVLPDVFILEQIAPGMARFRIAGSALSQAAGMELRGMPLSALFRLPARPQLHSALEACFSTPAVVEIPIEAHPLRRGRALRGTMILLPMTCDLGRISRALGAVTLEAGTASEGYRLDLAQPLIKPIWSNPAATPVTAAAEPAAPFLSAAPHLTLVHSTD